MTTCPECHTDNRPTAKFCRNCGIPLASGAAPTPPSRTSSTDSVRSPTVLKWGAAAIGAVLILAGLSLLTRGGGDDTDGDGSDGDPADVAEADVNLAVPQDVRLTLDGDECGANDAQCPSQLSFVDESEGESGYVARFDHRVGEDETEQLAPVDGTGATGRLNQPFPVDDPVCVTVRPEGPGPRETSDPLCRMAVITEGGWRLVDPEGARTALDLQEGQCAVPLQGQLRDSSAAWFRVAPCDSAAGGIQVYDHQVGSTIQGPQGAAGRCQDVGTQLVESGIVPSGRTFQPYFGDNAAGRPTYTCAWLL